MKIKIDKKLFFTLLKNNKNLQLSPEEIIILANALSAINSKENLNSEDSFKSFGVFFSITQDLVLMFSIQGKISKDIQAKINLEFERIKAELREIEENSVILKQTENLKLTGLKLQRYARNISREDVVTEYIKI
jgi:hypothetical protein